MKIAIGVCAKNEQFLIKNTLDSIIASAKLLQPFYEWQIYLCLNSCTDQTEMIVNEWISQNNDIKCTLISLTEGNLVEAQRSIVNHAKSYNIRVIAFFDADIEIQVNCLETLVSAIQYNNVKAAYAISRPMPSNKTTFLETALNLYDISPTIFTSRKHLHGRAFIIKDWNIPQTTPPLIVDDIYLSFSLLLTYGHCSIKRVDDAIVYHKQINNFKDFYRVYRRRTIELRKCFTLFPEFNNLPSDHVNRLIIWDHYCKEPCKRQIIWLYLMLVKCFAAIIFKIERFFDPIYEAERQWYPSITSKRVRSKPFLVLIEGLDCSGKKTIARLIMRGLISKGISSYINIGPLGPLWFNSLVRFVSLHSFPNKIRSFVYAFEGMGDGKGINKFSFDVVLQVSSPMRSWAYADQNKQLIRLFISRLLRYQIADYDQIWLLTASYKERLHRHYMQVAAGENSDNINKRFTGQEMFESMDKKLEMLLSQQRICGVYDTTVKNPKEISELILGNILNNYMPNNKNITY